ncbi:hypothetical protein DFH29DRAFT_1005756 [Suillus ampliporus]|nr:hypothetical protein DFH29DRAFT_1005756 [Suillus ampliporus]
MAWTKIKTGDQPWLNDQETTALQSHVEDWEKASGTKRQRIFKAPSREAKLFALKMDKELLKEWKEKDEQGGLLTSRFDFNEQLSKGSSFMKCKDWQVILPAWEDVIGDAFDQDQDSMLLGGTCRVPKPYYEFDLDHMGLLIFPDIDGFSLDTKKGMIWSFLTIHYRICCGKPEVPVPWSDIMKEQSRFISSTYLPDGTQIMEPSKMHWDAADTLLECWLDQQDNQVGLTFEFKAWIDDKDKMHPPISEESDDSDADDEGVHPRLTKKSSATAALSLAELAKDQPRLRRQAYISSADEESSETDADVFPPKKLVSKALQQHGRNSLVILPFLLSAAAKSHPFFHKTIGYVKESQPASKVAPAPAPKLSKITEPAPAALLKSKGMTKGIKQKHTEDPIGCMLAKGKGKEKAHQG